MKLIYKITSVKECNLDDKFEAFVEQTVLKTGNSLKSLIVLKKISFLRLRGLFAFSNLITYGFKL